MFNSIKTFAKNTAAKVKSAFAAAEAVFSRMIRMYILIAEIMLLLFVREYLLKR